MEPQWEPLRDVVGLPDCVPVAPRVALEAMVAVGGILSLPTAVSDAERKDEGDSAREAAREAEVDGERDSRALAEEDARVIRALERKRIDGMERLIASFDQLINDFKLKGHDLLDYNSTAFERDFVEAQQAAYIETCIEDDEIAERMDAGRKALMQRGDNEVGPYQSPMEDGMQHFHEWYRAAMGDALAP